MSNSIGNSELEEFKVQSFDELLSTVVEGKTNEWIQKEEERVQALLQAVGKELERIRRDCGSIRKKIEPLKEKCSSLQSKLNAEEENLTSFQQQFGVLSDMEKRKAKELKRCKTESTALHTKALKTEIPLRTLQIENLHIQRNHHVLEIATVEDLKKLERQKVEEAELERQMNEEFEAYRTNEEKCKEIESAFKKIVEQLAATRKQMEQAWEMADSTRKTLERMNKNLKKREASLKELESKGDREYENKIKIEKYRMVLENCRNVLRLAEERELYQQQLKPNN